MLLLDIEEQIKPMSKADKMQLIRDVWHMLQEEMGPDASQGVAEVFQSAGPIKIHPPVDSTETARELEELLKESKYEAGTDLLAGTKYEYGWDFDEAAKTAEQLQAIKDKSPKPKPIDWARMTIVNV